MDEYLQSDSCKFEIKQSQNYWVATEKAWIYSLRGKENLSIQCVNGYKTFLEIENSGVLLLNEKCIANGSNFMLESLISHHDHSFPIFKISEEAPEIILESYLNKSKINDINWDKILNQINELENREKQTLRNHYHHFAAPYMLAIILLILFIWWRRKNKKKNKTIKVDHSYFFE